MDFRYCFIIFMLFLSTGLRSQYNITGEVRDVYGISIERAEVHINDNILLTDSLGLFSFNNLPAGDYHLKVIYKGDSINKDISLLKDEYVEVVLALREIVDERKIGTGQDENVSVLTVRKSNEDIVKQLEDIEGTSIYAGKKSEVVLVENVMGNKGSANAREIYAGVTGLNIYENSRGGLQLNIGGRGLDPSRTANFNTRQNGYDISADVLGYPESYYTPPVEALHEIQVVRGAASLQYGTQFGGLINFKLKSPVSNNQIAWESRQTIGTYNLITSFNRVSGTIDKFSYQAYYNYKSGDGFRPNSHFNSNNFFAQITYQWNKKTKISFESTYMNYLAQQPGGMTDAQYEKNPTYSNRPRNWFRVNWQLYAMRLEHHISSTTLLSAQLFSLKASRKALGFRGNPFDPNDNVTTFADVEIANGEYEYPRDLIIGNYLNWGAEIRGLQKYKLWGQESVLLLGVKYYQADNESIQGPGSKSSTADFKIRLDQSPSYPYQSEIKNPNLNLAFFGENVLYVNSKLSITPGFRLEYIKTQAKGNALRIFFDNSGNELGRENIVENRALERTFLLLGLGASYKPVKKMEFYANFSQNYKSISFSDLRSVNVNGVFDPNLQDATGFSTDLGARGNFKRLLEYDIDVFSIYTKNRIGVALIEEGVNKGTFLTTNIGDAVLYGLETFLDWNILKTWGITQTRFGLHTFLNLAVTNSKYLQSKLKNVEGNQVEFVPLFNIKTGIRFKYKNIKTGLQFTYLSRQYTDATNADTPSADGTRGEIPSYQVVDFSVQYKLKKIEIEAGVNNLLDKKYFTQRATGYPGPGIIPSDPRTFYIMLGWQF